MEMNEFFDEDVEEEKKVTGSGAELWVWKGKGDPIKVEVSKFKGKHYMNVREWYLPKDKGLDPEDTANYKPTKKGINIDVRLGRDLIKAMETALSSVLHEG